MTVRNQDHWLEVERLPPFANDGPYHGDAWLFLEKLQRGRLTVIDILTLKSLLTVVYDAGKDAALTEVVQDEAGASI